MFKRLKSALISRKVIVLSACIIGSCFLLAGIVVDAQTKDSVRLRIGNRSFGLNHEYVGDEGVDLDLPADPSKKYHVLTEEGATLYIGKIVEHVDEWGCRGNDPIWRAIPERSGFEKLIPGISIVVETSNSKPYEPVKTKPVQLTNTGIRAELVELPKTVIHDYISHLSIPQSLKKHFQPGKYQHVIFSAGKQEDRKRIILLAAPSHSELKWVQQAGGNGIFSIAEVIGGVVKENFTYPIYFSLDDLSMGSTDINWNRLVEEFNNYFRGMADINQDRLADVFLLDSFSTGKGYDNQYLLIEEGTKWRLEEREGGRPPC